jgi:hypothetical protein
MLQKRVNQMREEEEARTDAIEVSKAAERFKNVGSELQEWEDKHGSGSSAVRPGSSTPLSPYELLDAPSPATTVDDGRGGLVRPSFPRGDDSDRRRASSTMSLLHRDDRDRGTYDSLSLHSPPLQHTPSSAHFSGLEELLAPEVTAKTLSAPVTDPELESKIRLLEEVKKAREEVRGSLDKIRSNANTPTPSMARSGALSPTYIPTGAGNRVSSYSGSESEMDRRASIASSRILDHPERTRISSHSSSPPGISTQPQSEWESYLAERRLVSPSSIGSTPGARTSANLVSNATRLSMHGAVSGEMDSSAGRRERTTSMMEPQMTSEWGVREELRSPPRAALSHHYSNDDIRRTASFHERPSSFAESHRERQYSNGSITKSTPMGPPLIIGSAAGPMPHSASATLPSNRPSPTAPGMGSRSQSMNMRPQQQRTMTYEEHADRHRQRLSKLQDPVTAKMKEEVDLARAKAQWERQKKREAEEMKKREEAKAIAAVAAPRAQEGHEAEQRRGSGLAKEEALRNADEWRRSIHTGLDGMAGNAAIGPRQEAGRTGQIASGQGSARRKGDMGPPPVPRGMPQKRASQYSIVN